MSDDMKTARDVIADMLSDLEGSKDANQAQIEVDFQRMKHWERTQDRADQRFEARMAP